MDNQLKNILKYALTLFIITAISAALLASVNLLTSSKIAENAVAAENDALREVMADAQSFEPLGDEISEQYGANAIYLAKNDSDVVTGCCVKVAQNGYGGEIMSVIGVGTDGLVTGVSVISHSETPGLGANLTKESFKGQFVGKGEVSVVKAGAKEGQINAISGATISSKALTASVNAALDIAGKVMTLTNEGGLAQ